ncbi:filamentous hemagglutinin N-terminal domain-containing protein, partial [Candidatus Omnitrophota bacterium]
NRVTGTDPSDILGSLTCNGLFALVNENGITFGPQANLDVGSMIASTRDITDSDFLAANYLFNRLSEDQVDALLLNQGVINVRSGGFGILIAGAIENRGVIAAPVGTIAMAAGDMVRVDISAGGVISVAIDKATASTILDEDGKPITDQIKSTGTIEADGGVVMLKAESATDVFTKAINLEGYVRADTVEEQNGVIKIISSGKIQINAEISTDKLIIGEEDAVAAEVRMINGQQVKARSISLAAHSMNITSLAGLTEIYRPDDIKFDSLLLEDNLITLVGEGINITYLQDSGLTLKSNGAVATESGVIIQATRVRVDAREFGSTEVPLKIQAESTHINRINGNIDIMESIGMGTSILVRGPPEEGFGSIIYSADTNLFLEADKIVFPGEEPTYFYSDITFYNFECLTPGKEIYFEAGHTYTFLGTTTIQGTEQNTINLHSSVPGEPWFIHIPSNTHKMDELRVWDSHNIGDETIFVQHGLKFGDMSGWLLDPIWDNDSGDSLWSNGANWNPNLGDPETELPGQDIFFDDGSSDTDSIQNIAGLGEVASFTIQNSYSKTLTLNEDLTVTGNFHHQGDATFTLAAEVADTETLTVKGDFAIDADATFTVGTNNPPIVWQGTNWNNDGTFNCGSGTVTVSGAADQALNTGGDAFNNLTIANTAGAGDTDDITIDGTLDVDGTFTLTSGELNVQTNDPAVNIAGDMTVGASGVLDLSSGYSGTWTFDGSGTNTLKDNRSGNQSYGEIYINGTSKTLGLGHDGAGTVTPVFTTLHISTSDDTFFTDGNACTITTLDNNGTLQFIGSETANITITNMDIDTGTVKYVGDNSGTDEDYAIKDFGSTDYFDLTIADRHAVTPDTYQISGDLTVAGDMTVTKGTLESPDATTHTISLTDSTKTLTINGGALSWSAQNIDLAGGFTISSGSIAAPGSSTNFTIGGNWSNAGGTFTSSGGTVTFDGGSAQTIASGGTGAGQDFDNITINNSSSTVSITAAIDIDGTLKINHASAVFRTFNDQSSPQALTAAILDNIGTLRIVGSETVDITTMDITSGIVEYVGDGQSDEDTYTLKEYGGTDYFDLKINADDTQDIFVTSDGGNTTAAGDVTITSGTVQAIVGAVTAPTFKASGTAKSLSINNANGRLDASGLNLDLDGALNLSAGQLIAPASDKTFTIAGTWTLGAGVTFNDNSGTVTFDGASTQNITSNGESFNHLVINKGGGAATLLDAAAVAGNLTVQLGELTVSIYNLDVTGNSEVTGSGGTATVTIGASGDTGWTTTDMTIGASGVVTCSGNSKINVGGSWDGSAGTFNADTSTVTFNATSSGKTIKSRAYPSSGVSFYNIVWSGSGGEWTLLTDCVEYENATVVAFTAGTLHFNGFLYKVSGERDVTLGNGFTLDVGSGYLNTNGWMNLTVPTGATVTVSTGTLQIKDLTVSGSGTFTVTGAATIYGEDVSITSSNFTAGQSTLFQSSGTLTLSSTQPLYNYQVGFIASASSVTLNSDLTVQNNFTILANSGNNSFSAGTHTINVGGNWDNNDIFDSGMGRVTFDGGAAQAIYAGGYGANQDFYDVTISNTAAAVTVSSESMKVSNSLTVDASTQFTLADTAQVWVDGGTLTLTGTPVYAAASCIIDHNAATYDYYAGSTGINKDTLISDFDNTDNVTIKAGTFPQNEAAAALSLTIANGTTYTVSAGNLDVGGNIDIDGTLTGAGTTISLEGNWDNGGTFNAGASTVTLDGTNQSILGSSTFNNLTKTGSGQTLTFAAGTTQTVTGTTTLQGNSRLILRSSTPGTQWNIDPQGGVAINDVDVQDSNNLDFDPGSRNYIDPVNSVDSGNNTGWFTPKPPDPPEEPGEEHTFLSLSYEEGEKLKKRYPRGKYRTIVIVYEGRVVVSPYDEKGIKEAEAVTLTDGQQTAQEGFVQ